MKHPKPVRLETAPTGGENEIPKPVRLETAPTGPDKSPIHPR